jgi:hypothetical protein
VAVPDDAFITEFKEFSLKKTISNIEGKLEKGEFDPSELEEDDILPSAAKDMGTGKLLLHFDFRGYIQAICDPTP